MKRFMLAPPAALFGVLVLAAGTAKAQNIYPYRAPNFGPGWQTPQTPWLQMLRLGDPAANYYIGVVPEFQRREDRNRIYGSLQGLTNLLPTPPRQSELGIFTPLPSTGHLTAFGYTGSYFGGMGQMGNVPRNPFPQKSGASSQWPKATPPPGQPPGRPK